MIIVNDLKPGITIEYENNIYTVLDISHNKTAMRQMIVKWLRQKMSEQVRLSTCPLPAVIR